MLLVCGLHDDSVELLGLFDALNVRQMFGVYVEQRLITQVPICSALSRIRAFCVAFVRWKLEDTALKAYPFQSCWSDTEFNQFNVTRLSITAHCSRGFLLPQLSVKSLFHWKAQPYTMTATISWNWGPVCFVIIHRSLTCMITHNKT